MNVPSLFPEIATPSDIKLAEHAEVIRTLGKRAIRDIIEIGRRLTDAKAVAGHGNWLPWLEREFGWEVRAAQNFMSVYEASIKNANFAHLDVPVSGLYLLAAPSTPDEVREAIVERSERGETLTHAEVKKMIAEAAAKGEEAHAKELATKLGIERERTEKRIAKLTAEAAQKQADLESDLAGAVSVDQLKLAIEEAQAPLKRRIEKLQKQLEPRKTTPPPYPSAA